MSVIQRRFDEVIKTIESEGIAIDEKQKEVIASIVARGKSDAYDKAFDIIYYIDGNVNTGLLHRINEILTK